LGAPAAALSFGGTRGLLAALGVTGTIKIWDPASNNVTWSAPSPVPDASMIAFGQLCSCLAVGTLSGSVVILSLDRSESITVLGASGSVTSGIFLSDGSFIFATDDGRVWVTAFPSWTAPQNIGQQNGSVFGFAAAPNAPLAATVDVDGIAHIWDVKQRRE